MQSECAVNANLTEYSHLLDIQCRIVFVSYYAVSSSVTHFEHYSCDAFTIKLANYDYICGIIM